MVKKLKKYVCHEEDDEEFQPHFEIEFTKRTESVAKGLIGFEYGIFPFIARLDDELWEIIVDPRYEYEYGYAIIQAATDKIIEALN